MYFVTKKFLMIIFGWVYDCSLFQIGLLYTFSCILMSVLKFTFKVFYFTLRLCPVIQIKYYVRVDMKHALQVILYRLPILQPIDIVIGSVGV